MAYRYPYYSGPQASPGYNPYSKHPDWASGIRELLKNMMMMKQMKQDKEQRTQENIWKQEQIDLDKQAANLRLKDMSWRVRKGELDAKKEARLDEEAKEAFKDKPEMYNAWKFFKKMPPQEGKSPFDGHIESVAKSYTDRI
ncbi:MAG: hypothetical protein ACYS6W_17695, partial [Planctomycetota bacterium]